MNVLHIASILPVPNLIHENNYVVLLSKHLQKLSKELHFQFYRPSPYIPFLKKRKWGERLAVKKLKTYNLNGYSVHVLPYTGIASKAFLFGLTSWVFAQFSKLPKINTAPDLCHAHYILPDGLLALQLKKKLGIPYILTVQSEHRLFSNRFSMALAKEIIENSKAIICINPSIKKLIQKKINIPLPILVAGLGIDEAFFNTTKEEYKTEPFKILSVGQLYPLKNLTNQIKAVALAGKNHFIHYTIVGNGQEEDSLKELCDQLGLKERVTFIPHVVNHKLPELMSSQHLFMLASHKESWGKVYIEAMATGLPVILTKNTGVYQMYNKQDAFLSVDPNNIKSIAQAIETAILDNNLRNTLSIKGKRLVSEQSWPTIASRYLNIYKK